MLKCHTVVGFVFVVPSVVMTERPGSIGLRKGA